MHKLIFLNKICPPDSTFDIKHVFFLVLTLSTSHLCNSTSVTTQGPAGCNFVSCDVSLLNPFSYIDNTVGCFNYYPSVGESKPLQRHALISLPSFSSLQGTYCLLNIISLSSLQTAGLICGGFWLVMV